MNRFLLTLVVLCMAGACHLLVAQQVHPHYVDGELFWRIKDGAQAQLPDSILATFQVREVKSPFTPLNPHKLAGRALIDQLHRTYRLRFDRHAQVTEFASYLQSLHITELVERVPLASIDLVPNDPQFASQWHLATIDAANAWGVSVGNPNVRIAIVDDAVLRTHQDLAPSIWVNPLENPFNGIDDDLNGYINDVSGYDVADLDNNPDPPIAFATNSVYTHGTHCAGIAAAATNNGLGVASIGFGIKIIPVKCNNDATPGPTLPAAYDGVTYAITLRPEVMSLSWGGPGSSATAQLLFDLAYANDIVVVAAAGNSNVSTPMYPASYNHVISVAATDPADVKASFSNFGATIDVSAPGVNILSTLAGSASSYGQLSGTSMATPLTAGLCGLMRSFNPNKTVDEVETCLKSTCDPIAAQNPGYIGQLGTGRINALHAVQCVTGPPIAAFTQNSPFVCPGFTVQFTDQSYGAPTSWAWTFAGGTPATSTAQNPLVTYAVAGSYPVSLTVTNGSGSNTTTFNSIVVAAPSAVMSGGGLVNLGSPAIINVTFTGAPPFSFTYTDGSTNTTVSGILNSTYSFAVTPLVTTTYSLVSMNNAQCSGTVSGNALVTVSTGCGAGVNFQKIMGGAFLDNPYCVKQAPDCGYLVAGNTFSFGTGLFDAVLAKLDPNGNLLWFKTYGNAADASTFFDVIPVGSGYVCFGNRGVNNQSRLYIVKTDFNGVFQWQTHIEYVSGGGAVYSTPGEVVEMANGDLTIGYAAAHSNFNSTGQAIARLNGTNGAIIWQRNGQYNNFEWGTGISRTPTGNITASGYSRSTGVSAGLYDMFLTERDGLGNLVWSKNYGGAANDFGMDHVQLPDLGYLMVGYTQGFSSSVSDIMIVRTTSNGTLVWSKTYARPAADVGLKIVAGCNGKYFVAGSSRTSGAGNDALLFQIDLNGNVLWAKAIGGVLDDGDIVSLGRSGDCGCILGTSTISYGVGEFDYLIMKTDSLGEMTCHATPVTLTVTNITPSVFAVPLGGGNTPSIPTHTTTVLTHTPSSPASVCDACGTPVADFDYVTNVLSLACLDNSVNGQHWSWNFGDGSVLDTFQNAVHEYVGPGTYTVTLIVSSACGADTIAKTVTITGLNQCLHVLQPGPVKGFDTDVFSRDDATNSNLGSSVYYGLYTWTWSGNPGTGRSYLKFDLSRICNTATLLEGRFSANYDIATGQPHSGTTTAWLSRATSPWDEYAATWLNQPTTTTVNRITVPAVTGTSNLTNLLVTPLIQDMIFGPNYGMQWRHITEATYVRTIWNSSDFYDPATRPKLTLRFDPIFAYATAQPSGSHSVVVCPGDSVQLNLAGYLNASTTSGPSVATGYLWVPSTGLSCSTCANPMASPDSTITYRAVAFNCPSCGDIDTVRVTVSQVWVDTPDQILCAGDSVQMQAFHPFPSGTSFVWTPTTTLSPANVQYPYAYPTVPTWYHVVATDASNGCVSTDSALVLTGYPSTLPPLINDTTLLCNQGTLTFPLNPDFTPIGSDYYSWNLVPNITPDPHAPSSDAIINTNVYPATYHYVLTVTNAFGCVTKDSVNVNVACVILPADRVQFAGRKVVSGNALSWQTEAGFAPQAFVLERSADGLTFEELAQVAGLPATSQPIDYERLDAQPLAGDNFYRLKVVDEDGAFQYTETILLGGSANVAITIYPNPTTGRVTLSNVSGFLGADIRVFNALGQLVMDLDDLSGAAISLDLSGQARGAYLIEMKSQGAVSHIKVMLK